jgi:hypothetical protein
MIDADEYTAEPKTKIKLFNKWWPFILNDYPYISWEFYRKLLSGNIYMAFQVILIDWLLVA